MKERPIIFSSPMVRAILEGRKTMTRRPVVKPNRPYEVGMNLWVKETWRPHTVHKTAYKADGDYPGYEGIDWPWKPSIHMPRWASRITLEITNVRIERLQEITIGDARREGIACEGEDDWGIMGQHPFAYLWNSVYGKDAWDKNPWVWVIEFRRI